MSSTGEMIEEVADIVKDDLYDEDSIQALLNGGLLHVASRVLLPELDTTDTITTDVDVNVIALPEDFHRNLYRVDPAPAAMSFRPSIVLVNSPGQLKRLMGVAMFESSADVMAVTLSGKANLMYGPRPIAPQDLMVSYYRKPTQLITDDDVPDCIPAERHHMLVDYACYRIFAKIEDGIEGQKVNTKYHYEELEKFFELLEEETGQGKSMPPATVVAGDFL